MAKPQCPSWSGPADFGGIGADRRDEALRRDARDNLEELITALDKAQAEAEMFRKICKFDVKLSPAGKALAKYALSPPLSMRHKDVAELLRVTPAALTKYGNS